MRWLFWISPTLLFTPADLFRSFYALVFDGDVTYGGIFKADGNRLRLQTNASNCGPEMQNKYACHQDGCRRVIIWFSTERLGGGDSEDNCCLSWESSPQQLRCNDKKWATQERAKERLTFSPLGIFLLLWCHKMNWKNHFNCIVNVRFKIWQHMSTLNPQICMNNCIQSDFKIFSSKLPIGPKRPEKAPLTHPPLESI